MKLVAEYHCEFQRISSKVTEMCKKIYSFCPIEMRLLLFGTRIYVVYKSSVKERKVVRKGSISPLFKEIVIFNGTAQKKKISPISMKHI